MTGRRKAVMLLAVGAGLGMGLWIFSPWITGRSEPWDAERPIWLYSWVVIAMLGGLAGHVRGACLPLGYALGQMLVTSKPLFFGDLGMLALGWMFIVGYAGAATAATLVLAGLIAVIRRFWRGRGA